MPTVVFNKMFTLLSEYRGKELEDCFDKKTRQKNASTHFMGYAPVVSREVIKLFSFCIFTNNLIDTRLEVKCKIKFVGRFILLLLERWKSRRSDVGLVHASRAGRLGWFLDKPRLIRGSDAFVGGILVDVSR